MRGAARRLGLLALAWCTLAWAAAPTFALRVPYAPYLQKLKASGGARSRIVHLRHRSDLARLEDGKRYKFTLTAGGDLAVAPLPADAPKNPYVHPVLAAGKPVLTAGGLRVERTGSQVTRVILDQDSQSYCPSFQSLAQGKAALIRLGVPGRRVELHDQAPDCSASSMQKMGR